MDASVRLVLSDINLVRRNTFASGFKLLRFSFLGRENQPEVVSLPFLESCWLPDSCVS